MAVKDENSRATAHVVIDPSRKQITYDLREFWEFRELFWYLALRDISVRYKQAILGAIWVVLQPFCMMVIFSLFLGFLVRVPTGKTPYPLFVYTGLLAWQCFANTLSRVASCLMANRPMVTKVYFPRLVLPISNVIPPVIDMGYSFIVFIGMMFYFHAVPSWHVLWLPVFLLLLLITALGVGLWLAIWYIKYHDIEHLLPVILQMWMFASPVTYPDSLIHRPLYRMLYGLNPMAGVVDGFRWALLGTHTMPGPMIGVSAFVSVVILITGLRYFRKAEREFADVI